MTKVRRRKKRDPAAGDDEEEESEEDAAQLAAFEATKVRINKKYCENKTSLNVIKRIKIFEKTNKLIVRGTKSLSQKDNEMSAVQRQRRRSTLSLEVQKMSEGKTLTHFQVTLKSINIKNID